MFKTATLQKAPTAERWAECAFHAQGLGEEPVMALALLCLHDLLQQFY